MAEFCSTDLGYFKIISCTKFLTVSSDHTVSNTLGNVIKQLKNSMEIHKMIIVQPSPMDWAVQISAVHKSPYN